MENVQLPLTVKAPNGWQVLTIVINVKAGPGLTGPQKQSCRCFKTQWNFTISYLYSLAHSLSSTSLPSPNIMSARYTCYAPLAFNTGVKFGGLTSVVGVNISSEHVEFGGSCSCSGSNDAHMANLNL